MFNALLVLAGLVLLAVGAEILVRGATGLAAAVGISPLMIGLTVVAFGTGGPELAVAIYAGVTGQSAVALGNVVGSNIFNTLAVLGIAALISPLAVQSRLVRFDLPVLIGVSLLAAALAWDDRIDSTDAAVLLVGMAVYLVVVIWMERRGVDEGLPAAQEGEPVVAAAGEVPTTPPHGGGRLVLDVVLVLIGLAMLAGGSKLLVDGASAIARGWGMSEVVIGLTIVAVGTSLPEVFASGMATWRGKGDLAVGNAVGSSVFNLLAVLGAAGLATAGGVPVEPSAWTIDLPVMVVSAVVLLPLFVTGRLVSRPEGTLLLGAYVVYLVARVWWELG